MSKDTIRQWIATAIQSGAHCHKTYKIRLIYRPILSILRCPHLLTKEAMPTGLLKEKRVHMQSAVFFVCVCGGVLFVYLNSKPKIYPVVCTYCKRYLHNLPAFSICPAFE